MQSQPPAPQEHQSAGNAGKLALLSRALRHESPGVRHAALGELLSFMRRCKGFLRSLVAAAGANAAGAAAGGGGGGGGGGGDDAAAPGLLPDLMGALLACCDNAARSHLGISMRER